MDKQLFRKASLDRISSPEEMHDYMHCTTPRAWMVLVAFLALILGFAFYASSATMENVLPIKVSVMNFGDGGPSVFFELPLDQKDMVKTGMTVRFQGESGKIDFYYLDEETVGAFVTMDNPGMVISDGKYDAEIVTESSTPFEVLFD